MQQPPQNPEQPSYPYQPQQPGPGMFPSPQYQQEPYSQYQPNNYMPPPPRKKGNKTLWIVLGVVGGLLVVSLAICGIITVAATHTVSTAVNNIAATVTADTSSSTSSSSSSSSNNQVSKVGGTITLNGVQATLVSVKTNPGTQYETPKAGNEYVVVHVKLQNTSSTEQQYNEFEFHVKSGTGNITSSTFVSFVNSSNMLNSGTLAAGGTTEGDFVFQVKKGDHQAELTWQPSFFGNQGDNGWILGL
ncbi:MAG: DUF4352 domain-containing protein [Ktedonobacteraceae bacterium]